MSWRYLLLDAWLPERARTAKLECNAMHPLFPINNHSGQTCEDMEDEESLRHLYTIIRSAILLNDAALLELLLSEDNVMDTV